MAHLTKQELRRDPIRDFLMRILGFFTEKAERAYWALGALLVLGAIAAFQAMNRPKPNPETQLAYLQAITWLASGDTTRALPLLKNLTEQYPGTPEGKAALYYLGTHYLNFGDPEKAKTYLDQFLKSNPQDPYLKGFALSKLGDIALDQGDPEQALAYYEEAAKLVDFPSFHALLTLKKATALKLQGRYQEALSLIQDYRKAHRKELGGFARSFTEMERELEGLLLAQEGSGA